MSTKAPAEASESEPPFLVFGSPLIDEAEIDEVVDTLRSGWIGTGPKVARFEEDFRTYVGAAHAVAVASCTAALHLSLYVSGVGRGDEVIVPAMTFCATANAVIHSQATPVHVDCDLTGNIDPDAIEAAITPRTRAVVVVHFAGRACAMERIVDICRRHDLLLIEDCAHAIETTYRERHAGTFGAFGCFSFYVTKNVVTGEGGMIISPDPDKAGRVKSLALHGMSRDAWKRFSDTGYRHYEVQDAGFKYNMTDLQASIGIHQLGRVESTWQRRNEIWNMYNEQLKELPIGTPEPDEPGTRHARHLYTVLVDPDVCGVERDQFLEAMTARGIGIGVHYLALAEHSFYRDTYGWSLEDTPIAARFGRQTVSIPLSAKLQDSDIERVVEAIRASLATAS